MDLTPEIQKQIVALIHSGTHAWVAAEAAGVPLEEFQRWMRIMSPPYSDFQEAIRKAAALARVSAEMRVKSERPLEWLTKGPGRSSPGRPGWGDRVELSGVEGGPVQVEVHTAVDYTRLSTPELEELDAIEKRREELLAKARVTPPPG